MLYRWLADVVVCVHLAFILFAVLGALLTLRWPRVIWGHLPVVLWAFFIEIVGWRCPLTPLENLLRQRGGESGYASGFVEQYIVPVIYPTVLTREIQVILGVTVVLINLGLYAIIWRRRRQSG
ncbi:MAG: DUF2784 domain-containing protein [bacterium]